VLKYDHYLLVVLRATIWLNINIAVSFNWYSKVVSRVRWNNSVTSSFLPFVSTIHVDSLIPVMVVMWLVSMLEF